MNNLYKVLFVLALSMLSAFSAKASEQVTVKPEVIKIVYSVARQFNIDAQDLIKIAYTESRFKINATRTNKNGTVDFGMFQINSVHWSTTCKEYDITKLKGNVSCAAKIVSSLKVHSDTDENWLGRYHSKTPSKKLKYVKLLAKAPNVIIVQR